MAVDAAQDAIVVVTVTAKTWHVCAGCDGVCRASLEGDVCLGLVCSGLCLEITHNIKTLTVTQRHRETQTFILTEKDSSVLTLGRGVTVQPLHVM